jgi:hypothetical protein
VSSRLGGALPHTVLVAEIDRLRNLGIVFTQNHKIKDLLAEQKEGGFDAVLSRSASIRSRCGRQALVGSGSRPSL